MSLDFIKRSIDYTKVDQVLLFEILKLMKEIRDELKDIKYENQKIHGELADVTHLTEKISTTNERVLQVVYEMTDGPNTHGERRLLVRNS